MDIFYRSKNAFRITTITLVIVAIVTTIHIYKLKSKAESLQSQIVETNIKLEEANKKIQEIENWVNNIDISYGIEFERTWRSIATMRNNFVALGKGYHLEKEDICPEEECPQEYEGKEEL